MHHWVPSLDLKHFMWLNTDMSFLSFLFLFFFQIPSIVGEKQQLCDDQTVACRHGVLSAADTQPSKEQSSCWSSRPLSLRGALRVTPLAGKQIQYVSAVCLYVPQQIIVPPDTVVVSTLCSPHVKVSKLTWRHAELLVGIVCTGKQDVEMREYSQLFAHGNCSLSGRTYALAGRWKSSFLFIFD